MEVLAGRITLRGDLVFYRSDEAIQLMGSLEKIKRNLKWQLKYSFEQFVHSMADHNMKLLSVSL